MLTLGMVDCMDAGMELRDEEGAKRLASGI
jgi:hypothetical protein